MPHMKPPHYKDVQYSGRKLQKGETVEVDERDAESLERAGWSYVGTTTAPKRSRFKHTAITEEPEPPGMSEEE